MRPCGAWRLRGLLLIAALCVCVNPAQAQDPVRPDRPKHELYAGWGVNPGQSWSNTDDGFSLEAFYDVPIGSVYFSPGMRVMFSVNSMFSVETRVRVILSHDIPLLLGIGGNVMIWEDRAAIGIPVELSLPIGLTPGLHLNPGLAVTPHFFLGKEKDGVLTTAFVGLRFPVL